MQKVKISLPPLTKENIRAIYVQLRPYREGGYRIQPEILQNKIVFHNYGHGGSGVSLSFGSVRRAVQLWRKKTAQHHKEVGIIGCGIIGLLTALQLTKYTDKITIYSKSIPKFGRKENKQMITSEIAPGFWFPYDYLFQKHLDTIGVAKETIEFLKDSTINKKYQGIKQCQTFDQLYGSQLYQALHDILIEKQRKVNVDFGSGNFLQYTRFKTYRIDMQLWIKQLMEEISLKGVKFIKREFLSLKDVINLKQEVVFNCAGYGARYLFGDQNMKPLRGHIIQFQNTDPSVYNYIFGTRIDGMTVRVYCHQSRILLGLTREETQAIEIDEEAVSKLLKSYQSYFRQVTIPSPRL